MPYDVITVYIKDTSGKLGYNKMYKFSSPDDMFRRVELSEDCPCDTDVVVEGYKGDSLVSVNEQFGSFVYNMKMIAGLV